MLLVLEIIVQVIRLLPCSHEWLLLLVEILRCRRSGIPVVLLIACCHICILNVLIEIRLLVVLFLLVLLVVMLILVCIPFIPNLAILQMSARTESIS